MLRAIILTIGKDFRLLRRDRVGLFMLLVAPVAVIAAAGFSLANIYESATVRAPYGVALVDEARGAIGRAIREGLQRQQSLRVIDAAGRAAARRMVRESKDAVVAVIVPGGATRALQSSRDAEVILYTDPVRYLQTMRIELLVAELCRRIAAGAVSEARARIAAERGRVHQEVADAAAAMERLRAEAARDRRAAEAQIRAQVEAALVDARRAAERALDDALAQAKLAAEGEMAKQREAIESVKSYLARLQETQREFERWLQKLKQLAGRAGAEIPPAPSFPQPPAEIASLGLAPAAPDFNAIRARGAERPRVPEIRIEVPAMRDFPKPGRPDAAAAERAIALPGSIGIVEYDLMDRPVERGGGFNAFNLHVPGFAVTFLMIGMLMGVSLALIDERDWGTLDRLRSASAPLSATLAGKLIARFVVGFAQMIILFAAGWALFDVSLGTAPAALLLPSAAVAFAGAAFGLVVAGVGRTRDAVLPVGAIVIMTMAAVGGCWWPLDFEPEWMQQVALAVPTTWAMQAYNDLMIRGLPPGAALWPSAVNVAFGLGYIAVGVVLVRRRFISR